MILVTFFMLAPPAAFASPAVKPSPIGYVAPMSYSVRGPVTGVTCVSNCTFVTNLGDNLVQVLSASGKLEATISLPTGGCSYGANQIGMSVFFEDYCLGQLDQVSVSTLSYVKSFSLSGAIFGAWVPSVGELYVAQFGLGTVTPFNPLSGAVGSPITVCNSFPEYITYNGGSAGDGLLYVPARINCYSTINPTTNTASNYNLGSAPNGVACISSTGNCYISDTSTNVVYEVKGGSTIATISSSSLDDLWGIAFNPYNQAVYVTSYLNNAVVVISGSSVTSTITNKGGGDADCFKNGYVVQPLILLATAAGYGLSTNRWNTPLGTGVIGPESCG